MQKIGYVLQFPMREIEASSQIDFSKVIELPMKIVDEETQEELSFRRFKWDDKVGAFTPNKVPKQKIRYQIENTAGIRILRFVLA